jgi:hypothetical protein
MLPQDGRLSFQEESTPYGQGDVFVRQFCYHAFAPFSIPFLIYFEGWKMNHVQKHLDWDPINVYFNIIMPCVFWSLIGSVVAFSDQLEAQGISLGEIIVALGVVLTHRGMVSSKYAMLSPQEYARLRACPNRETGRRWQDELQIISGWMAPAPYLIKQEIVFAAEYSDVELGQAKFLIDPVSTEKRRSTLNKFTHAFVAVNAATKILKTRPAALAAPEQQLGAESGSSVENPIPKNKVVALEQLEGQPGRRESTQSTNQSASFISWTRLLGEHRVEELIQLHESKRATCNSCSAFTVSGNELVLRLIENVHESDQQVSKHQLKISLLIMLAQAMIPAIVRVATGNGHMFGSTREGHLVCAMSFILTFTFAFPLASFLGIGVQDMRRQYMVSAARARVCVCACVCVCGCVCVCVCVCACVVLSDDLRHYRSPAA